MAAAAAAIDSDSAPAAATSSANSSSSMASALSAALRDALFELGQFVGGEAHRIGHGLAMDEAARRASASPDGPAWSSRK